MAEVHFKQGDSVITQGDDGDVLYVVDNGQLDCFKRFSKGADNTYLKTYGPGESFGELALLYNAPRAASIISKTVATCFTLDRATFNHIVRDASMQRRTQFEEFLNKVPVLSTLDQYEKGKIAECLESVRYESGDFVIKEGDHGSQFFLIEEGTAEALKLSSSGQQQVVYKYNSHDYFGELSLLRDEPRAASIRATSALKVAHIDRLAFKRLFGPLENILERNTEKYAKFMKSYGALN